MGTLCTVLEVFSDKIVVDQVVKLMFGLREKRWLFCHQWHFTVGGCFTLGGCFTVTVHVCIYSHYCYIAGSDAMAH